MTYHIWGKLIRGNIETDIINVCHLKLGFCWFFSYVSWDIPASFLPHKYGLYSWTFEYYILWLWILVKLYGKCRYIFVLASLDRFRPHVLTCFMWAVVPVSFSKLLQCSLALFCLCNSLLTVCYVGCLLFSSQTL